MNDKQKTFERIFKPDVFEISEALNYYTTERVDGLVITIDCDHSLFEIKDEPKYIRSELMDDYSYKLTDTPYALCLLCFYIFIFPCSEA